MKTHTLEVGQAVKHRNTDGVVIAENEGEYLVCLEGTSLQLWFKATELVLA